MGRSPCCDKAGLKKGPWTPEEDQKLLAYIEEHGHGSWRALPAKAGLQRCGKSCRLRWTNYLRPDIKRGKFSTQEEQTIIQLHALLGNRWSAIATHLAKRTDNEIKNYWNTHLKKRLAKMGIDPVTHKPKNDTLLSSDGQTKTSANLSHMAQWESARLEAEARLVRESKLRSHSFHRQLSSAGLVPTSSSASPTSTLTFSETAPPILGSSGLGGDGSTPMIELVGATSSSSETGIVREECERKTWKIVPSLDHHQPLHPGGSVSFSSSLHQDLAISIEGAWTPKSLRLSTNNSHVQIGNAMEEGFTNLLLNDSGDRSEESDDKGGSDSDDGDCYEDNKNYWSSILNLVNSSPSDSPIF